MSAPSLIRVLVADDHALARLGLRAILQETVDIRATVESATAPETLDKARHADVDLVILDISMPGRSGLELIRELKDEHPNLPILIMSAIQKNIMPFVS